MAKATGRKLAFIMLGVSYTFTMIAFALIATSIRIHSQGNVKALGVGAYWDYACTQPVSTIDWGAIEPNSTKDVVIFIRHEGNAPANLSLTTENWQPPNAADYMTLTWDYDGHTLNPQEIIAVTLTLNVSENVEGITDFSYDIVIGITG